jgi:hypothetical protein
MRLIPHFGIVVVVTPNRTMLKRLVGPELSGPGAVPRLDGSESARLRKESESEPIKRPIAKGRLWC